MFSGTSVSSPMLPGGWASTWTLAPIHPKPEQRKPLGVLEKHVSSQDRDELHVALSEPPKFPAVPSVCDDQVSACLSFNDSESAQSDDFHSFMSQQDEDTTSSPTMIAISHEERVETAENILTSRRSVEPGFNPTELASRLDIRSREDIILADDTASEVSAVHPPTQETLHLAKRASMSSLVLERSNFSKPASTITAIRPSSLSSGGSVTFRKNESDNESESVYSNQSGLNYARPSDPVARLETGNSSEESFSHPSCFGNTPRQIQRRRINHENTANGCELSQPDGHGPWTLSLGPPLTPTQSISTSTVSLTFEFSNASQEEDSSEHYLPMASPQSPSFPLRHYLTRSIEGHGVQAISDEIMRAGSSANSPFPYLREGPPTRSKKVIKKTKELCGRFKRFIVSKASKHPNPSISQNYHCTEGVRPPVHYIHSSSSPKSSRSVGPRSSFSSPGKTTTYSVAHSTGTEVAHKNQAPSIDDKHSYEYHARPKTLAEIRQSNRRFSLPVVSKLPAGCKTFIGEILGTFPGPAGLTSQRE